MEIKYIKDKQQLIDIYIADTKKENREKIERIEIGTKKRIDIRRYLFSSYLNFRKAIH